MTDFVTLATLSGGGGSTLTFPEDILAKDGGVISSRGPIIARQNVDNGFDLCRQHFSAQGNARPALSIGDYPHGLWVDGTGTDADGYGSQDSGGGTYINLSRDHEGVYQTSSWWLGFRVTQATDLGVLTVYNDTEAWGSARRSYFQASVNLSTGNLGVAGDSSTVISPGVTFPIPGWNDNKYNRFYCSLTTWMGKSSDTGQAYGKYVAFQFGSKVVDLRNVAGSADYPPSGIAQPGSSFSGGNNPGVGITNVNPGKSAGLVIYDYALTIGDVVL